MKRWIINDFLRLPDFRGSEKEGVGRHGDRKRGPVRGRGEGLR